MSTSDKWFVSFYAWIIVGCLSPGSWSRTVAFISAACCGFFCWLTAEPAA